jgi:CheY-like chemotaxis protein/anti-sigma regulatory factor (Ser/Thr protein kinase)
MESVRNAAEMKSVTLEADLGCSGCWIRADSVRLRQVLQNLLTNAVKFTPPGGKVTVRAKRTDDRRRLEIQVEDTGKGIKPEFVPRLFTRFMQEDSTTKRDFGGLGLGLSIVRNLVEMHRGTVAAFSAGEGKGAVFTVTLPCVDQPAARDSEDRVLTLPQEADQRTAPFADLSGLRVLVIDDLSEAREVFSMMLQSWGAHVETAPTAASGLEALAKFKPDVVLCDIAMPGEDGFGFIRSVRALAPSQGGKTLAVALTAFAAAEDAQRSLEAGFDAHLAKPVDAMELSHLIAKLAGRLKEQSEIRD